MRKAYMGVRLRRLREEKKLKQIELAQRLGISPSYLNQLEQNQRPLTLPVLLRINAAFGLDVQLFSGEDEMRLFADLREALADSAEPVSVAAIRELATGMPEIGRALLTLHRDRRDALERNAALAARLGRDSPEEAPARLPFEQVRDYFYARHNHVEPLDEAAEQLYREAAFSPRALPSALAARLEQRHGVRLLWAEDEDAPRHYDPEARTLHLSAQLSAGQQAFQMATQLALLDYGALIDRLADSPLLAGAEARRLARIGLANYFAGALLLPYGAFLAAAEEERYDIERLGRRFGVGFETVGHRLSTLQRPEARGVPFFFVRVDRADNISKRQSATDFHFSRVGGSCPLWNVYEAFAQPGRVLTQIARMPDGRTYLWIARTVGAGNRGYGAPGKSFAIGLGCDIRHADRLVYSRGLNLADPEAATPIGPGCKLCERPACPQRAFPPIGRPLAISENDSRATPYPVAE